MRGCLECLGSLEGGVWSLGVGVWVYGVCGWGCVGGFGVFGLCGVWRLGLGVGGSLGVWKSVVWGVWVVWDEMLWVVGWVLCYTIGAIGHIQGNLR